MTREQFYALLHHPATIRLNLVHDLEELTEQYPYFQNAHLLLAKQYKGHQNIRFEQYLRKASAYAPDRSVLFELIHQEPETLIHIGEEPALAETTPAKQRGAEHPMVEKPVEQMDYVPVTVADSHSELPGMPESDAASETFIRPEAPVTHSKNPQEILEARLREIEQKHRKEELSAPGANQVTPPVTPVVPPAKERPAAERKKPAKETAEPIPSPPVSPQTPVIPRKPAAEPVNHTFLEWLKLKQVPIEQREDFPIEPAGTTPLSGASPDLVEQFIQSEPRIVPARSEFYSPGNMARQSAVDHEDLISETLARIYANQGNIPKAIDTLNRLSLKIPGKSGYFAALIQELTERNQE